MATRLNALAMVATLKAPSTISSLEEIPFAQLSWEQIQTQAEKIHGLGRMHPLDILEHQITLHQEEVFSSVEVEELLALPVSYKSLTVIYCDNMTLEELEAKLHEACEKLEMMEEKKGGVPTDQQMLAANVQIANLLAACIVHRNTVRLLSMPGTDKVAEELATLITANGQSQWKEAWETRMLGGGPDQYETERKVIHIEKRASRLKREATRVQKRKSRSAGVKKQRAETAKDKKRTASTSKAKSRGRSSLVDGKVEAQGLMHHTGWLEPPIDMSSMDSTQKRAMIKVLKGRIDQLAPQYNKLMDEELDAQVSDDESGENNSEYIEDGEMSITTGSDEEDDAMSED